MKTEDLERKMLSIINRVDLRDLYVEREAVTKTGKPKLVSSPITVVEFLEKFLAFDMDATVIFASEYDISEAELVIKTTRLETDEELDNRIAALKAMDEHRAQYAKKRRTEVREHEIVTLKKLIAKYKGVVDVN